MTAVDVLTADVLVVGGGPAGLSAARAAAEGGCRTLLLERGAEIGWPVRTSGASWLQDLADLGVPASLAHPVRRVRFAAPGREAAWDFAPPRVGILDVRGTWQHLARQAAAAGATIQLQCAAVGPLLADGRVVGVQARTAGGGSLALRAAVTVDASGGAAVLATAVGLRPPTRRQGVGAEVELSAPAYDQDEALLLVGRALAPRGYAWAFPRGEGRVRVGVGVLWPDETLDPRALLERLTRLPALARALEGAERLEEHAGAFPSDTQPPAALSRAGLLVAGDAALQGSLLVGEGIRYAIRAGRLAGAAAAEAVRRGDTSATFLAARYDRPWRRRFGREAALAAWLNRRLARYGDRNWRVVAALLACLSPEEAAAGLHADFGVAWTLRLAARAPTLAAAAAGALRRG